MDHRDYYSILGVGSDATEQDVRAAYRKLAFRYHPDRNKEDAAATAKMKEINEAYAVLSNAARRREYDLLKDQYGAYASSRYRQSHSAGDMFAESDIEHVFQEFARQFGFREFNDIFNESGRQGYRSFEFRAPGTAGRGFVLFRSARPHGAGAKASPGRSAALPGGRLLEFLLKRMAGIELPRRGRDWNDRITISSATALLGGEIEYPYTRWGKARNLMVKIPPGTHDGQQIRLKGMGGQGNAGGEPGDLYLRIRVRTTFWRKMRAWFGWSGKGQAPG